MAFSLAIGRAPVPATFTARSNAMYLGMRLAAGGSLLLDVGVAHRAAELVVFRLQVGGELGAALADRVECLAGQPAADRRRQRGVFEPAGETRHHVARGLRRREHRVPDIDLVV